MPGDHDNAVVRLFQILDEGILIKSDGQEIHGVLEFENTHVSVKNFLSIVRKSFIKKEAYFFHDIPIIH